MSVQEISLFGQLPDTRRVINTASVRQLSPFRYPGGKTWFVPYLKQWLSSLPFRPTEFIEPFTGGGSVSMTVLSENLADTVTLIELDAKVSAVWQAVFSGDADVLSERILGFEMTLENVTSTLSREATTIVDQAFQTILRNRVNRGGILAHGAGMIKEGENGKGLRSRWYPETLSNRILVLSSLRDRVQVIHGDGFTALENRAENPHIAAFVDPPYTAGGKRPGNRLYNHWEIDHERLFTTVNQMAGDFVMTYDNVPEVLQFSERHGLHTTAVSMKTTHHEVMTEVLVGRNLGWVNAHSPHIPTAR
jgi:DNA adenine methylase